MKTIEQLAMWFIGTMGFLNHCEIRGSLAVRRQFDWLGESLATFLAEIAKRTQGATLDDFIRTAPVLAIKQEIQNTLLAVEELVNDLNNPAIHSGSQLAEALKDKITKEPELRGKVVKSFSDEDDPDEDLIFLEEIIEAIGSHDGIKDYPARLISCAERLMVLAKNANPDWRPPITNKGIADLSDLLRIEEKTGSKEESE